MIRCDSRADSRFQLVFTAALKAELPLEWLRCRGVPVLTVAALKDGALGGVVGGTMDGAASGAGAGSPVRPSILFAVTGVGPAASGEAAAWIRNRLRPLFVVNLGTAGAPGRPGRIGEWVQPESVSDEAGRIVRLDGRLPFPWPAAVPRPVGGELVTLEAPMERNGGGSHAVVDMECAAQADVFDGSPISFHALKWISDPAGAGADEQFRRSLPRFREAVRKLLGFLDGPGEPAIAVVIPVHDRHDRIVRCVASVLAQTLPPAEVVVVDDGSTDGTAGALEPFAGRVNVVRLENNRGAAAARNIGARHCRAPWLCFLDSDDLWKTDKLERQWRFLEAHSFYQILQCGEVWIRNGVRVNPRKHHAKPEGWIWQRSLARCLVSPSAVMIRRGLWERSGGFDEELPVCEDYDLWIRIARRHPVGLDPSLSVVKHGGHPDQLSRRYAAMDGFRVRAMRKALEKEIDEWHREALVREMRYKLDILIQGCRKRGREKTCREYEEILRGLEGAAVSDNR